MNQRPSWASGGLRRGAGAGGERQQRRAATSEPERRAGARLTAPAASATAVIASTVALARPRTTVTSSAVVGGERELGLVAVGGGDADRALGLAEAVEVVAVAVVEVAVERLLLGQPLARVLADRGAHVAEHGRRLAAGRRRRPHSTLSRAEAANSGVIQLKKAPS